MASLKELLEGLEIDVSDLEEKKDEINLKDIKLDDIPEKQRPIFQKLIDNAENLTLEVSKRDIVIKSLKDAVGAGIKQTQEKDPDKKEKILGVLESDDPYAPAFQKIADAIEGISAKGKVDKEKEFETNLIGFAKENKDIVKYVKDMDALLEKHPTLKGDIPTLYTMAKNISERRLIKASDKKDELEKQKNANRFRSEGSGISGTNVVGISNAKTISEAFDLAEKKIAGS